MKISYGLLELERIVIKGEAHYAHLKQHITCELAESAVDHEVELLGFVNGSCVREVYYRIPAEATREELEMLLQSYPNARIIRIISHEPILSAKQQQRVQSGVISKAEIAKTQVIVDQDKNAYIDVHGLPVSGQNRFSLSGNLTDQDQRWELTISGVELEDAQQQITKSQLTIERRVKHEQH